MSHHRDAHQAQLEDLVHRNRTLDQTIKRLQQELDREQTRANDAIAAINTRWSQERAEWRAGCDTILACHTIAHLRTTAVLEAERISTLKAADDSRKDHLALLQRDYRLTLFQIRESEQDTRIAELEDELEDLAVRNDLALQKSAVQRTDLSVQLEAKHDALLAAQRARDDLQEKHTQMLQELATLRTTAESTASQLERTALQLDGAQTTTAELAHANEDLKRTNTDLRRQLDKWQTLDTKGVAEVDAQRKRRIELEVRAKTLESRLSDAENHGTEISAALEKEKRMVEKLKGKLEAWKQATDEAKEETEKHRTEAVQASKKVEKQQKMIEKLKAELESERAHVRPASPVKPSTRDTSKKSSSLTARPGGEDGDGEKTASSEDEVVVVEDITSPVPTKVRARLKPRAVGKGRVRSDVEASTSGKGKAKPVREQSEEVELEIVEGARKSAGKVKDTASKGKGKRRAGKKDEDEDEDDDERTTASVPSAKAIGKRKADADDRQRGNAKVSRAPSRGGSVQPGQSATSGDRDGETVPRKKKRTINIFGPAQDMTFEWGGLSQGDSGLGIPTSLSPLKESSLVPNRSASFLGRMGSVIGNFRR